MPARVLAASLALLACAALAQPVDPNLQNLLSALTSGAETTLVTPLRSGMLQVTSFAPGTRVAPADAMALVNRARAELQSLGEPQPTAEEIARMLAGGPIELASGRVQATGLLPAQGNAASIRSQIVAAGAASAAAGASAPPSARESALRELAALGIINPSEDQVRTALAGGTITTLNGVYQLPGVLTR